MLHVSVHLKVSYLPMLEAGACAQIVSICLHVWVPACILCVWVHAFQHAHMCAIVWGEVCVCVGGGGMHACVIVWACVCVCVWFCVHVCMCVCVSVCMPACMHVWMHVCVSPHKKKFGTKPKKHTVSSYSVTSQSNVYISNSISVAKETKIKASLTDSAGKRLRLVPTEDQILWHPCRLLGASSTLANWKNEIKFKKKQKTTTKKHDQNWNTKNAIITAEFIASTQVERIPRPLIA